MVNKDELISRIAAETGKSKKETGIFLNSFLDVVTEALMDGERVQIIGFGAFEVRDRKERLGRNPKNPTEVITVPAYKAPFFQPGKGLKEAVN